MSYKPKFKRFKNINTVRAFVSKRIRELEEFHCKDPKEAPNLEAHRVMATWTRLLAEIVTASRDRLLEERLKELEKVQRTAPPVSVPPGAKGPASTNIGAGVQ